MRAIALALSLTSCVGWHFPRAGRIYTGPHDHIGVRPSENGLTVQWSTDRVQ